MKFTPFPLINAVLCGQQNGELVKFDSANLIVHKSGFSFIEQVDSANIHYLVEEIASSPQLPRYFHIYAPPESLVERLNNDDRFGIRYRKRFQLRFTTTHQSHNLEKPVPDGFVVVSVDPSNFDAAQVFELELDGKFWNSRYNFLDTGFGQMLLDNGGKPVSLCYACCVVNDIAEIDIATIKHHQSKGYGKIVTNAFLKESISRNIGANWDCFEANRASLKIAIDMGFEKIQEYQLLSVYKN